MSTRSLALLCALAAGAAAGVHSDASCSSVADKEHVLLQRGPPAWAQTGKTALTREPIPGPDQIYFDATIRDFTASHPDFQFFDGHSVGLVKPMLGADKKPIFNGGPQLSNKTNFDQWYRDVPGINKKLHVMLDMFRTPDGTYVHENNFFFPLDGQGWNDSAIALDGEPHNFYFTLELHTRFVYRGSETFMFRGDDDVWVFIDDKLVIDLGGVHHPMEGAVSLDSLNLTLNSVHELSFFFAERLCCGSAFRIETTIQPMTSTCMIWGDPHIDVFDNRLKISPQPVRVSPFLPFYSSGDYWLVNNRLVQIQGRYGPTQYTAHGQSALLALAVGGPFLRNHTLIIEQMDGGKVTWDGEEILQEFPSEFLLKGFVRVNFNTSDQHIDVGQGNFPVKMIQAQMPRLVHVKVNRWAKHIDAIIRMVQQPDGQDGHCGNFNGNPDDDTKELIDARMGAPVPAELSLLPPQANGSIANTSSNEASLADCPTETKAKAHKLCEETFMEQSNAVTQELMDACIFDVCFGGADFAEEDAVTEHESQEESGEQEA